VTLQLPGEFYFYSTCHRYRCYHLSPVHRFLDFTSHWVFCCVIGHKFCSSVSPALVFFLYLPPPAHFLESPACGTVGAISFLHTAGILPTTCGTCFTTFWGLVLGLGSTTSSPYLLWDTNGHTTTLPAFRSCSGNRPAPVPAPFTCHRWVCHLPRLFGTLEP